MCRRGTVTKTKIQKQMLLKVLQKYIRVKPITEQKPVSPGKSQIKFFDCFQRGRRSGGIYPRAWRTGCLGVADASQGLGAGGDTCRGPGWLLSSGAAAVLSWGAFQEAGRAGSCAQELWRRGHLTATVPAASGTGHYGFYDVKAKAEDLKEKYNLKI